MEVTLLATEDILDLRHRILRAGLPADTARFEGDDETHTFHAGVRFAGKVIGCVTLLQRPYDREPAWQLRGMAIDDLYQRQGIGSALLLFIEGEARRRGGGKLLWCNARLPAVPFYESHGWVVDGPDFEIEDAGPHCEMVKPLPM